VGPAIEFNWGAAPNLHLHLIAPAAAIFPADGPRAFGIGDIELGIKYRFIQETKHRPQIGTFTMFEIPTGSAPRGLGVGKTWYKVPLWAQKSFGPWTTYGGGGVTVFSVPAIGTIRSPVGWCSVISAKSGRSERRSFITGPKSAGAADTSVHAGRFRRLLQIPRSRFPIAVLLWAFRHRANGELCVPRAYWTLGQESG